MKLMHTTPRSHLASISQIGIDPRRSEGKIVAAWLHTSSRNAWAVAHTQKRHKTTDVITLTVDVPRGWLTRRWRGIWTCDHVITEERIKLS